MVTDKFRAYYKQWHKEKYRADSEFRNRRKEYARAYYWNKKNRKMAGFHEVMETILEGMDIEKIIGVNK